MKRLLVIAMIVLLSGCGITTPVKRNFPEVPSELRETCPDLKMTEPTEKISEVVKVVTDNYSQYHECRIKVDAWTEWYNTQKKIADKIDYLDRSMEDRMNKSAEAAKEQHAEIQKNLQIDINKVTDRVDVLERWRFMIVGGAIVVGYVLGNLDILTKFLK